MNPQVSFQYIQPYCVNVAKRNNVENINCLLTAIKKLISEEEMLSEDHWSSVIDDLKEYIIFPLYIGLKKMLQEGEISNEPLLERIFSCLILVLSKSGDVEWKLFQDLLMQIFVILTTKDNPQKVASRNEDCQRLALNLVCNLCSCLDSKDYENFCSDAFRPQLGHAIFITLKIAENEKSKEVRIAAIEALNSLGLHKHWLRFDERIATMLRLAFVNFLPGISISMMRIATGSDIQGHKITVASLDCLCYYLTLVMKDNFIIRHIPSLGLSDTVFNLQNKIFILKETENIEQNKLRISKFSIDPPEQSEAKVKNVKIDRKWVSTTNDQLSLVALSLGGLVRHSHWRVRKALVKWADSIVTNCARSMNKCLIPALDILITLSSDPMVEIVEESTSALANFRIKLSEAEEVEVMELLEERLFALATKLPTIVRTQEDAKTISALNQIYGTLDILSSRLLKVLSLPSHLNRILSSLVNVLRLDTSDKDILNERLTNEEFSIDFPANALVRESFVYFHSPTILSTVCKICHTIGRNGDIIQITDWCLDVVEQDSSRRKEVLLLLNFILKGANSNNSNSEEKLNEQVVGSIVDMIINLNLLNFSLQVSSNCPTDETDTSNIKSLVVINDYKQSISVESAKSNVLLTGCTLKLLGTCSLTLKQDFKMFLSDVLCLMMEKAGDSNVYVSHSAFLALEDLRVSLGYSTVEELIEKSVSQFWFSLSQKLKKLPDYPSSPLVLRFALRCSGEVKKYIEDLVEDVLGALDSYHLESALPLSIVLLTFVEALASKPLFKDKELRASSLVDSPKDEDFKLNSIKKLSIDNNDIDTTDNFFEYLKKLDDNYYLKNRQMHMTDDFESNPKDGFDNISAEINPVVSDDGYTEEPKKEIPNHILLITHILEKCSYQLFTKDRKLQLVILQIVSASCEVLQSYEDQKLPAFHKLWKPLVLRLKDKDFVVSIKSLETAVIMIKTSGDFMRKRFITEVFPLLLSFLKSQSLSSFGKKENSGYHLMPAFKAQLSLLRNLSELVKNLELGVLHAVELTNAINSYLDSRQPSLLVSSALDVCRSLYRFHPDLVWISLTFIMGPKTIESESIKFTPLIIRGGAERYWPDEVLQFYSQL